MINLYNARSQTVEAFHPLGETVRIYVCGITPYDTTHLGHAFTYVSFDTLIRYLEYRGYAINYVQNVTDIDDDILRKAAEVGEDWQGLGDRWTAHFIRDLQTLNVRPPDHFPRATQVISEIVDAVQKLIELGLAYEAGGSVYYEVKSWPNFGQLSRIPADEMLAVANERGNRPDDPNKRDPLDFVLWQAAALGEPTWNSPWGAGRPGWHIECSTMSSHYLGQTIDIHGGGGDLIFPHHECEIAQAEPIINAGKSPIEAHQPFSQFWLHTAMVHHQGEKMSKSLGNLIMVRDLLKTWSPDALRLYLGSYHYRHVWSHDPDQLTRAERLAQKLKAAVSAAGGQGAPIDVGPEQSAFDKALAQDFDTPGAQQHLEQTANMILTASGEGKNIASAQQTLRKMTSIFGLRLDSQTPEAGVVEGWGKHLPQFV